MIVRYEDWSKEWKALNVIPMGVGDQDIGMFVAVSKTTFQHIETQEADAGSASIMRI